MADIRLFTQQFNGTPEAKLSIVQPSRTTEYLPYGEDVTVYIGSSDTLISTTTSEINSDTGAIFIKVWSALRSKHYPVIGIDNSTKVFTFTGQDITIKAGKPTGKYYFISQTDGVTEYLEVSNTGCQFTDASGITVIEVDESAIEGGTSNLWVKVNPLNGQCTIAVKRISDQGKTIAVEYFSLESYSSASLPPAYRFMSQSKWLTISATGDTLSQIATSQEIVYIEMFETNQAVARQTAVAAILANKLPIFMWSARGKRTYGWLAGFTKTAAADGEVRINRFLNSELIIITLSPSGDSSDIIKLGGGGSYTARSPLHISESGEIYMDPVGASPLSNISTPPLDVLTSTSAAAGGGGHGNGWCSMDGHLFSIPNFFEPEETDFFEYIVTQSQSASAVSTHYIAIYELDEDNRQLNLCILSQNAAQLDSHIGVVTVPVGYIDPVHGTIKPSRLYYACHICDQPSVVVAGLTGNTFNLNPNSATQPIGITKTNFCSTASDGSIDVETIKTVPLANFGMLAERHFVGLKHQV